MIERKKCNDALAALNEARSALNAAGLDGFASQLAGTMSAVHALSSYQPPADESERDAARDKFFDELARAGGSYRTVHDNGLNWRIEIAGDSFTVPAW